MDKKTAEALFDSLANALNNAEKILIEIIRTKAWQQLGYETFTDAWNERLAGVRLATGAMRAHVVYALLEEGLTNEEVIKATMTPDSVVKSLAAQRADGVPAGYVWVRGGPRRVPPRPISTLHVKGFDPQELARLKATCRSQNLDVDDEVRKAIRLHLHSILKAVA